MKKSKLPEALRAFLKDQDLYLIGSYTLTTKVQTRYDSYTKSTYQTDTIHYTITCDRGIILIESVKDYLRVVKNTFDEVDF